MIKANVILECLNWKKKIKNPQKYLKKKLKIISKIHQFKRRKQEFSLLLTNNKKMKFLNKKFRSKSKTTDVLSFPLNSFFEKNIYLGDIAISYEIINKRSKKSNFNLEFDKMWVHGYLHLNGYKHKKNKDYYKMKKKEDLILKNFYQKT